MIGYTNKDWDEDFHLENGIYECSCHVCGSKFIGHKRRPHCKICATEGAKNYLQLTDEQKKAINEVMNRDIIGT